MDELFTIRELFNLMTALLPSLKKNIRKFTKRETLPMHKNPTHSSRRRTQSLYGTACFPETFYFEKRKRNTSK